MDKLAAYINTINSRQQSLSTKFLGAVGQYTWVELLDLDDGDAYVVVTYQIVEGPISSMDDIHDLELNLLDFTVFRSISKALSFLNHVMKEELNE